MRQIQHFRMLFTALRTAILFFAGFLIYEILIELEKIWNLEHPENKELHFYHKKIYKFILIFIIDLALLYLLYFITGHHF